MLRDVLSNKWILGGVGFLILLSVACVLWYQHDIADDRQQAAETQKIEKHLKPLPKKDTNTTVQSKQDHEHPHDDAEIHSHASETPNTDKYDWLNGNAPNPTPSKKDPWKQIKPLDETTTGDDETYPPCDWHKTEDPELYATYYYAQLLKQFGDIPEVHIIGEHRLNKAKGIPTTLGKLEVYLEAMYSLFPVEENKVALDKLQEMKASDATVHFK
ncbi:MAG: hypothetical protein OXU23_13140 [Candidatus Poribacteria bacterium]|nr:hypothetical protein [Candidatus Poribacteria bacterium]